jgi:uncharacterized SAM-binding protein YcdF (DUF218 family)
MAKSRDRQQRARRGHPVRTLLVLILIVSAVWFASLYLRIDRVAQVDQAEPSDAIAVFGAAQYRGHPSPVFHARLDHVVSLYRKQIAPLVITLGGEADDHSGQSEGGVGRDYLLAQGVPYDNIVAETESIDTEQQARKLAQIAAERGLKRIVVVSDGTHLFRIRELCEEQGLNVLTSPRAPFGNLSPWGRFTRISHEMLSYTFLSLHLHAGWAKQWMESWEDR